MINVYNGEGFLCYKVKGNYIYDETGVGGPEYVIKGNQIFDGHGFLCYEMRGSTIYKVTGSGGPAYRIEGDRIYDGEGFLRFKTTDNSIKESIINRKTSTTYSGSSDREYSEGSLLIDVLIFTIKKCYIVVPFFYAFLLGMELADGSRFAYECGFLFGLIGAGCGFLAKKLLAFIVLKIGVFVSRKGIKSFPALIASIISFVFTVLFTFTLIDNKYKVKELKLKIQQTSDSSWYDEMLLEHFEGNIQSNIAALFILGIASIVFTVYFIKKNTKKKR